MKGVMKLVKSINEQHEKNRKINETLLYKIGYDYTDTICEETDKLLEEYKNIDVPDRLDQWFDHHQKDLKRKEQHLKYKKVLTNVFKRVAIVLVAIILATTVLTFTVEAFRVKVFNFLIKEEETHTSLSLSEDQWHNISKELPEKWTDYYYPSYLPEGFVLTSFSRNMNNRRLRFENEDAYLLMTESLGESVTIQLDSEDAKSQHIDINGHDVLMLKKNGMVTLSWFDVDRVFVLLGTLEDDDMILIAEKIKKFD